MPWFAHILMSKKVRNAKVVILADVIEFDDTDFGKLLHKTFDNADVVLIVGREHLGLDAAGMILPPPHVIEEREKPEEQKSGIDRALGQFFVSKQLRLVSSITCHKRTPNLVLGTRGALVRSLTACAPNVLVARLRKGGNFKKLEENTLAQGERNSSRSLEVIPRQRPES